MTSSLVGSEMCIRDRHIHTYLAQRHWHIQDGSRTGAYLPTYADSTIPVSYTHLTLPTICSV
eukprot:9629750-Prorocentrum_lima.AAC.1